MSRDLIPSESEALQRCGGLLRYATENIKVPQEVVSAICAAWDAQAAKTWDQQIAANFWVAFNSLCDLIKPVNINTLSTNLREIPIPKWKLWRRGGPAVSLSERTARRYVFLLTLLLVVSVFLGFLVSTELRLSKEIEDLISSGNDLTKQIAAETDALEPTVKDKKFSEAGTADQKAIALLQNQLQELNYVLDRMGQKTHLMSRLISFGSFDYQIGTLQPVDDISELRDAVKNYYVFRRDVVQRLLSPSVTVSAISSSILPIILGIMGACAYVVRLISEQIKGSSFSSTSPIRHRVRVALGGLAGVVIGFGGVATPGSLS
jgi:hypothetical protein